MLLLLSLLLLLLLHNIAADLLLYNDIYLGDIAHFANTIIKGTRTKLCLSM